MMVAKMHGDRDDDRGSDLSSFQFQRRAFLRCVRGSPSRWYDPVFAPPAWRSSHSSSASGNRIRGASLR